MSIVPVLRRVFRVTRTMLLGIQAEAAFRQGVGMAGRGMAGGTQDTWWGQRSRYPQAVVTCHTQIVSFVMEHHLFICVGVIVALHRVMMSSADEMFVKQSLECVFIISV